MILEVRNRFPARDYREQKPHAAAQFWLTYLDAILAFSAVLTFFH